MFYRDYTLAAPEFFSSEHSKKYGEYKNSGNEKEWLDYTRDMRVRNESTRNLGYVLDDFMVKPTQPEFSTMSGSGNTEYDYENRITQAGAHIYSDRRQYDGAHRRWQYDMQNYKIDQQERKYADMLGLLVSSFKY